jgi:hypothetical protein
MSIYKKKFVSDIEFIHYTFPLSEDTWDDLETQGIIGRHRERGDKVVETQ